MTMSLKTIWNCRCEISHDSKSDASDDEYVTDDRRIMATERHQQILFSRRRKDPQHGGLTVVKPSDPAFDQHIIYRYYRHLDSSHVRLTKESKKLRKQVETPGYV